VELLSILGLATKLVERRQPGECQPPRCHFI
jgi:hypothetical protein